MHDFLSQFLIHAGHWGYLVIFIVVTLECAAVFFLPAETLVVIGGFFAARGMFDVRTFIAVVILGAILGYSIGFGLGRRLGRLRLLHYGRWIGLDEKHFNRVDAFFARYGGAAVVFGRFTWLMRAFVSLAAGTSEMPFRRFIIFNIAGALLWAPTFTLLGYFVGANWGIVEHIMQQTSLVVLLVLVAIGSILWYRRGK
jgi:membrane protein DedA with SNARE-associated domain